MASRINPVPLGALILCVILTLAFTVLVFVKSSDVRRYQEGDPEQAKFKSIPALLKEVNDKRLRLENAQKGIQLRQNELYQLDLKGNIHRLYYSDGELLGGVATPNNDHADIRGENRKLKDSTWVLTRDLIALSVKHMDSLKAEYEGPERQNFPPLDEAIKKRQDEMREVLKKINEQKTAFETDKDRLNAQLEALNAEKDKTDKKARDDKGTRETHINHLEERIRELLELDTHWMIDRDKNGKIIGKAGLEPDGSILQADGQYRKAIIDRGARDHVFPGLLFEVFTYDRGAYLAKGRVEVIEVQDQISTCRMIVQGDPRTNPISRGDFIGNPVFDARKPKVFFVDGEFTRYNKEDLESFIRRTGGIIVPALGPGVDFLVAGTRAEASLAKSRQYQILAMKEEDLLDYVQTTFEPKADKKALAKAAAPAPAPAEAAPDAAAPAAK
ncbi:MAG: hypothetical protein H0W83_09990 [Planctomycetes bacterium]|nr:hypothetical protein [Planctomycetota bacterium]